MIDISRYRDGDSHWAELAYKHARDDEYGDFDDHGIARLAVAYALQYDRRSSDESLIRFLLRHEIKARQEDSFQGLGDALPLLSFLLLRFKRRDDVPLFVEARFANFDTFCGYDNRMYWYTLREGTLAYLRTVFAKDRLDDFELVEPDYASLAEWWVRLSELYVDDISKERARTLYRQYQTIGESAQARVYFDKWRGELPETIETDQQIARELRWQQRHAEAAALEERVLAHTAADLTPRDQIATLRTLLNSYLDSNDWARVENTLVRLDGVVLTNRDWCNCGLGWDLLQLAFRASADALDEGLARRAYDYACAWLAYSEAAIGVDEKPMAPIGFTLAAKAAQRLAEPREAEFRRRYEIGMGRVDGAH